MTLAVTHLWRLAHAGLVLARYDVLVPPEQKSSLPWYGRALLWLSQLGASVDSLPEQERMTKALGQLGPSFIKFGQFLATRPDLVGPARAFALKALQDRLPPFPMEEARSIVADSLGGPVEAHFAVFGPPIAAASIAQVHRARTTEGADVAVKLLRPGIEKRFKSDIESFYFAARFLERRVSASRRLKPIATVKMLEQSMVHELDLRMEASAMSELAENARHDPDFRVPAPDWQRTARQMMTSAWIAGTPLNDLDALRARGLDLVRLGDVIIQSFLRHAIRDGFFHADMHQGNLFVDGDGNLVAVDFGITSRLSEAERMFLAEILYGFITRDYMRVSRVHFEAGYVPPTQDMHSFAQALRAIGEPIMGRSAHEISMARLLTQLFEVTAQFDMVTQPQLVMLQKTMVVVEGVARTLNPNLNIWASGEPVVRTWIGRKLGPVGKAEAAVSGLGSLARVAVRLPRMFTSLEHTLDGMAELVRAGAMRVDTASLEDMIKNQARHLRWTHRALVLIALAVTAGIAYEIYTRVLH